MLGMPVIMKWSSRYHRYLVFKCLLGALLFYIFMQFATEIHIHLRLFTIFHPQEITKLPYLKEWFSLYAIHLVYFFSMISLFYILGIYEKASLFFLWLGIIFITEMNPMIKNVSFNYIGFMLFSGLFLPSQSLNWRIPKILKEGMWFILALGYSLSGLYKLRDYHWVDGTAIQALLHSVIARNNFLVQWADSHSWLTMFNSYFTLIMEIISFPIVFSLRGRRLFFVGMTIVHLGIATFTMLTTLSISMLIFHFYLIVDSFEPEYKELFNFKR